MAKSKKSGGRGSSKCKTAKPKSPYSRPWIDGFLAHALKSADIEAACRTCGIGLGEYLVARRADPAFELACVELDLIVRAAAVACLESAAARGEANVGKMKLLIAGIEQLRTFAGDGPEPVASSLPFGAPAWLPDLVSRICGKGLDLVVLHAVESSYLAAVEWSESHPGEYHGAFPFPGPCQDCTTGLALLCPNPRCALPLIVRNTSDLPFPEGERWRDYVVAEGAPVDDVDIGAENVRFVLSPLGDEEGEESEAD